MGSLVYGSSGFGIDFDDRALKHLQVVISTKLRRGESFMFSFEGETGTGRTSVWLHPTTSLIFHFSGGRIPSVNRDWVEYLMLSANSSGGLQYTPEMSVSLPFDLVAEQHSETKEPRLDIPATV